MINFKTKKLCVNAQSFFAIIFNVSIFFDIKTFDKYFQEIFFS